MSYVLLAILTKSPDFELQVMEVYGHGDGVRFYWFSYLFSMLGTVFPQTVIIIPKFPHLPERFTPF